ncbi:MAG: hypothetical protein JOY90_13955 [Bradyrhizobium sp.]|uniref:hypothetical protein n=1 Tax=Bradyrhizobium sp. TaxID=376 RepID=UPI001D1CE636|nr:hypothetical protein [Bradyrhizobium sp.]MBV9561533.1 hypothetical protein [Bradyrhizobium sp.]
MGLLQMQRLGVTLVLGHIVSLGGLGTSHAAPSNAAETGYVHGPPCNDLCKAYMAWSDRVMDSLHPSRHPSRVVVHHKKPDRPAHPASRPRQLGLMPFAEHRRRPEMALHAEDIPHVQTASPEPASIRARAFPADQVVTAEPADAGAATNDAPVTLPASVTSLVSTTPDSGTIVHFERGLDWRFVISLGLAFCSLFSLMAWGWLRRAAMRMNALR